MTCNHQRDVPRDRHRARGPALDRLVTGRGRGRGSGKRGWLQRWRRGGCGGCAVGHRWSSRRGLGHHRAASGCLGKDRIPLAGRGRLGLRECSRRCRRNQGRTGVGLRGDGNRSPLAVRCGGARSRLDRCRLLNRRWREQCRECLRTSFAIPCIGGGRLVVGPFPRSRSRSRSRAGGVPFHLSGWRCSGGCGGRDRRGGDRGGRDDLDGWCQVRQRCYGRSHRHRRPQRAGSGGGRTGLPPRSWLRGAVRRRGVHRRCVRVQRQSDRCPGGRQGHSRGNGRHCKGRGRPLSRPVRDSIGG